MVEKLNPNIQAYIHILVSRRYVKTLVQKVNIYKQKFVFFIAVSIIYLEYNLEEKSLS